MNIFELHSTIKENFHTNWVKTPLGRKNTCLKLNNDYILPLLLLELPLHALLNCIKKHPYFAGLNTVEWKEEKDIIAKLFGFFKTLEIQSHKIIFIPMINEQKYSVLFVYKKYDHPYPAITDWDYVFLFLPFTQQYLILQNTDAFLYSSAVHVSIPIVVVEYT